MGPSPAAADIHVSDPTRTTAEVLVDLYRAIHEVAGDCVVLGCNVVGHLAAGLVQAQRTGDDTSGRVWERTRRMGVNTLAFRLAQHGRFFALDADCVASTPQTDWALNRQFLDLVARSGTALFVSVDPTTRTDAVDADLAAALQIALDGGEPGGVEPLDWFSSPTPSTWRCGDTVRTYDWLAPTGADPYEVGGTLYS
jgi:alpha-galactosidase